VLSEELIVIASKVMVQCRLHENEPNIDLNDTKLLLKELQALEYKCDAKDCNLREKNYGFYCDHLPWFLNAVATDCSSTGQAPDAKAIFDRLHAIEKARKKSKLGSLES